MLSLHQNERGARGFGLVRPLVATALAWACAPLLILVVLVAIPVAFLGLLIDMQRAEPQVGLWWHEDMPR